MSLKFKRNNSSIPNKLPSQSQLDDLEIRFTNCVFTYKLKHIETQPSKSRRRKVGKGLGFSFRPLRLYYGSDDDLLFPNCIFNPSDRSIMKEHIKNLETPQIKFVNCKFLRRDSLFSEKVNRAWKKRQGKIVKFSGHKGEIEIDSEIVRLKDLPQTIEFIIEHATEV